MVTPLIGINQPPDASSFCDGSSAPKEMQDLIVFPFGNFNYACPASFAGRIERSHPSGIKDLSTTGGIKRRPVQNHSQALAGRRRGANFDYIGSQGGLEAIRRI